MSPCPVCSAGTTRRDEMPNDLGAKGWDKTVRQAGRRVASASSVRSSDRFTFRRSRGWMDGRTEGRDKRLAAVAPVHAATRYGTSGVRGSRDGRGICAPSPGRAGVAASARHRQRPRYTRATGAGLPRASHAHVPHYSTAPSRAVAHAALPLLVQWGGAAAFARPRAPAESRPLDPLRPKPCGPGVLDHARRCAPPVPPSPATSRFASHLPATRHDRHQPSCSVTSNK